MPASGRALQPDLVRDYATRFHGNRERIDLESLELSSRLRSDVAGDSLD